MDNVTSTKIVTFTTDAVVVLERIEPGVTPDYCVHGRTNCFRCQEWCWLGDKTHDLVANGEAAPICIQCATEVARPEDRIKDVVDRRRSEGPHA